MGDVLRGAAALCLCKLACSAASVPSLSTSRSPVSWCCCCLLIFTDFLVTVFLSFLYVFQSRLPELAGDAIALRFLLFLSHTYGEVLLLIIPLIAVDALVRLLGPASASASGSGSGGRPRSEAAAEQQEESSDPDGGQRWFHVGCYLCCLSAWVVVALNVRRRRELEDVWSVTCVHASGSLIACLPRFRPVPVVADPCWGVVLLFLLLFLLLLLVTMNTGLGQAPAQTDAPVAPASSASDPAPCVDPGKTQSSCTLHREHVWNGVQMPTRLHGDSPEHKSTKGGTGPTFLPVAHDGRGFPRRASVTVGLVVVLSIFVLPLNLSVNILVIRTVETLLELAVKSIVSLASNTEETPAFHNTMLV